MKLTRVTISGADDKVPHEALIDLSAEFPFVEWGLLLSRTRQGSPRYPSANWLLRFKADEHCAISHHLCGAMAREAMSGKHPTRLTPELAEVRDFGHRAQRAQLNGFSDYVLPGLLIAERLDMQIILQCSTLQAVERAEKFAEVHSNVTALWDKSGGTGKLMDSWPLPLGELRIGYAGGIDEHSVVDLLKKLTGNREPHDFWIDLESGARTTKDEFDLGKVRRVLELASAFVGVADGGA